ncbi:hypothetical protein BKA66DRAFT_34020 [Pyrenochaeta sp. MPI-SDFR-AT-0127]|nr:hypothetical protein BKA66DRAFT_34020 [Pyrenochaeta sp. MPI-SDFR-AT-0127]
MPYTISLMVSVTKHHFTCSRFIYCSYVGTSGYMCAEKKGTFRRYRVNFKPFYN